MMRQETEVLRKQMRKVVREFDRLVEHVADRGGAGVAEKSKQIHHGVEDVHIGMLDLGDEVALKGRRAGRHVKRGISRHPWSTAAGLALAVATAVAFVAARRRRA